MPETAHACLTCGQPFTAKDRRTFCSLACRSRAQRSKDPALRARLAPRSVARANRFLQATCQHCAREFTYDPCQHGGTYCSRQCSGHGRRGKSYPQRRRRAALPQDTDQVLESGSVIHWSAVELKAARSTYGLANKWQVKITCGRCHGERWLKPADVVKSLRGRKCYAAYCHRCMTEKHGDIPPKYRGFPETGRLTHPNGYVLLKLPPGHPFASMRNRQGYVMEHRLVMAEHLGRPLRRHEHVHHKDRNKGNNALSNLEVVTAHQHSSLTAMEVRIDVLEAFIRSHGLQPPG